MKAFVPFCAIAISSLLIYFYLNKTERFTRLKKITLTIFIIAFILTELGRSFYRPYIYAHNINDYFISDTIGNSFGTVATIFFILTVVGKGNSKDIILISFIILGLVLYEGINLVSNYPFDIKDIVTTVLFGLLSIYIYRRLLIPEMKENINFMNKKFLSVIIIVAALLVGLMNTILIRPEDVGSWKNYVGYLFLAIAVVNFFFLIRKNHKRKNDALQQ